jgi:hypothetical protein
MTPFQLAISDDRVSRLKQKLALSDFPDGALEAAESWTRGVPSSEIKRLSQYWAHGFNWRQAEAKLNSFMQYTAPIQVENFSTLEVHFIHQLSSTTDAIPLLFLQYALSFLFFSFLENPKESSGRISWGLVTSKLSLHYPALKTGFRSHVITKC